MEYFLFVSHETSRGGKNNSAISQQIESLGEWIQVQDAAYLLWTGLAAQEVSRKICEHAAAGDKIVVVPVDTRSIAPGDIIDSIMEGQAGAAARSTIH